jgi:hypothetical protein
MLPGGGSRVAAISPDGKDFSLVIETFDAKRPQAFGFRLTGLKCRRLHAWRTAGQMEFAHLADVPVNDGAFTFEVEPGAIYSLTTTTGQRKGTTTIPPAHSLPLPYEDDFEDYRIGATPKYLSDFFGVFEVAEKEGGGKCLQQVITKRGIAWCGDDEPLTLIGSPTWRDYEVACDLCFNFQLFANLNGRVQGGLNHDNKFFGYRLQIGPNGDWKLMAGSKPVLAGTFSVASGSWHRVALRFKRDHITIAVDGQNAGTVTDATFRHGLAGIGCGFEKVKFDNLAITGPAPVEPVKVTSSSDWSEEYAAAMAVDGDTSTRWNAAAGQHTGWLELDFGKPMTVGRAVIEESFNRVTKFALEAQQPGGKWNAIVNGTTIGISKELKFAPVIARKFRLNILASSETPTIDELQLMPE